MSRQTGQISDLMTSRTMSKYAYRQTDRQFQVWVQVAEG